MDIHHLFDVLKPIYLSPINWNACVCFSQEEYKNKENIGILRCEHEYHADCFRRWLLEKNVCPMCKSVALTPGEKQWDLHVSLFLHAHFLATTFFLTNSYFVKYMTSYIHSCIVRFNYLLAPLHQKIVCISSSSVDMLTLGNYIFASFLFHFLCEWLNVSKSRIKPFYSYCSSLCFLSRLCRLSVIHLLCYTMFGHVLELE